MSLRRIRVPFQWPNFRPVIHSAIVLATVVAAGTLASAQSSLPEVHGLRFVPGDNQTLTWDATYSPAGYAIVMGQIPQRTGSECLLTQIQGLIARTNDLPPAGEVVTFLVGAQDYETPGGRIVNGPLGDEDHPRGVASCGPRVFVDPDATGAGTGLSWPDAYTSVARALDHVGKSQNVDVWLTGPIVESILQDRFRSTVWRIFGGFAGNETFFHERDPVLNSTEWRGDGKAPFWMDTLWAEGVFRAYLDGITFFGDPIEMGNSGNDVTVRNVVIFDGRLGAARGWSDNGAQNTYRVMDSQIECDSRCIVVNLQGSNFDIDVANTTIISMTGPAINVELIAGITSSGTLSLRSSTVSAEGDGLVATIIGMDGPAQFDLRVGSSVFECDRDAVFLVASAPRGGAEIGAEIVGNTFAFTGRDAISLLSSSDCGEWECSGALALANVRNNVFYSGIGFAVRESVPDAAHHALAEATLIGNDFYDNGGMLFNDGVDSVDSIPELNAIEGNSANFSLDPLFASPILGNFHLTHFSPLIDRCTGPAPPWLPYDMDGQPRTRSVFGGEPARCDVGADEY